MLVLNELRKLASTLPGKAPPIPIALTGIGQVGHLSRRQGIYINSAIRPHVRALLRDHYRAERAAREVSNGRLSAGDILPIASLGSDSRDAIKAIKSMQGIISSWDGVISARGNGKSWDFMGNKSSQTTVAAQWSSWLRVAGSPGAMAFNNIPGPAALDSSTVGAWPLPMTLGASEFLYLTNLGTNHGTGTNVVLAVDVLQAAGNVNANVTTTNAVSTTANPRWTGGDGLMMTLEITTQLGATAANATISYTDQGGSAGSSGAQVMPTSGIVGRLAPTANGPAVALASGDSGVRSIQNITFSAAMGAGVVAAIIYKPLLLVPTLATTTFVERSTPAQIGGIRRITEIAQATSKPCIGFFVLTSTTSSGIQLYLLETVWG